MTFDIFGTVVDWRRGLGESLGMPISDETFDRIVDSQGELERGPFLPYREIVARSLVGTLQVDRLRASRVGEHAGRWPLFPDSGEALSRLLRKAPCVATTNGDRIHGEQVQAQLGFRLNAWLCAEELGVYKPSPDVWRIASERLGIRPSPAWWHVSAYADYDLEPARRLGLTCVFVERPHRRPGPADLRVATLGDLARVVEEMP